MSGVNGGIDYEIDLSSLSPTLARQIKHVQEGPDSPTELINAATTIASSRLPQTLPVLVDMLGYNNPAAANIAVKALVEAGSSSIPHLLQGVAAFNYSVNAYALRALGQIGDCSVFDVCLKCAESGPIPNVRRAACKALTGLNLDSREDIKKVYECLMTLIENEAEWSVRYAALAAIEAFNYVDRLEKDERHKLRAVVENIALGDDKDPAVVARAQFLLRSSKFFEGEAMITR